jgi:hypothetical protein
MKLNAIVKIDDAVAHFTLSPSGAGVYQAELVHYEGRPEQSPPNRILLVRSIRHWTGSCDRTDILQELGDVIDNVINEAPMFKNESDSSYRPKRSGSPEQ